LEWFFFAYNYCYYANLLSLSGYRVCAKCRIFSCT
jgi:hypothetical protein